MRATADMWKRQPFGDLVPVPYRRRFAAEEFDRIAQGLVPGAMEDKWFIYYDEPALCLHRSWTGMGAYRIELEAVGEARQVAAAWCASELADANGAGYHAQLLEFLVGNLLLGEALPFPRPDGLVEPLPGVAQHAVAGTGYPERPVAAARRARRWWRLWR